MPFTAPLIDSCHRDESPMSDSGQWFNRRYWGINDYLKNQAAPEWALHWNDNILAPGAGGPGITIRSVNPGSIQDGEIYCRSNGLGGGVRLILRATADGNNFYAGSFGAPNGTWSIEKWAHGAQATVASRPTNDIFTLTGGGPSFWCGFRVVGDQIEMWAGNSGTGNPTWNLPGAVPGLTYTDGEFTSGHLGVGCQGIFTVIEHGIFGGETFGPPAGPLQLFTPPILLPYEKLVVPQSR